MLTSFLTTLAIRDSGKANHYVSVNYNYILLSIMQ
jgi:hypothetical protein